MSTMTQSTMEKLPKADYSEETPADVTTNYADAEKGEVHDAKFVADTKVKAPAKKRTRGPNKPKVVVEEVVEETPEDVITVRTDTATTVISEHFVASIAETNGIPILSVGQKNWVGPAALRVHANYVGELSDLLNELVTAK